ncbi:MAG: siroheme synthase [Caulobacter sp.]|nr:siroheme synthase [Caulobacter sp.]
MDAFPAFIPLAGRRVVIAGEGEAAEAKARLLLGSPAELIRLTGAAALKPENYQGAALAFIAGDDVFAAAAAQAARAGGALVNAVDRPGLSDFNTPAVIDRGAVVAAIGTSGAAPMMASMLRGDIEMAIPEGAGRMAALLQMRREDLRRAFPKTEARRAFLRGVLDGPVSVAALAGDMPTAERLLTEAMVGGIAQSGRVRLVAADGPAELLSLKAARALSEADVLVVGDADPGVVVLARRDAQRLQLADLSPPTLAAMAEAGRQVVVVLPLAACAGLALTLRGLGVTAERLLPAPAA